MQGEMGGPGSTDGRPYIRVQRAGAGGQHTGRWLHTLLGTGTECVRRCAGTCMSVWAGPLECKHGLRGYLCVNPWPQDPWVSTACGWLERASASRDSTQGLSRVHTALQTPLAMVSALPYCVARADLQAVRG